VVGATLTFSLSFPGSTLATHCGGPYADDINVMSLLIDGSCCFLQLNSLQFTKLWKTNIVSKNHPYASIYDSGNCLSIFL
jgi:hypothetical protein